MNKGELDRSAGDHIVAPAVISKIRKAMKEEISLWEKFMADNSFQHTAFPRALTPNHDDRRELQRIALIHTEQDRADLDQFPCELQQLVLVSSCTKRIGHDRSILIPFVLCLL